MAAAEAAAEAEADAPIAAFAVSKGGVVIKHIFLNAPPPEAMRGSGGAVRDGEEEDPPVMVGRHPDCHVLVDHPSVSRFHLQLRARRQQRRISVTDLGSVHGTWVSGRRIPPNTPVDLATGDMLRLGASKREYRLLWLSLREAFELEDPLHLPPVPEDKEEPHTYQEASSQLVPKQRGSVDMETHQETSQQIVSEQIAFPAALSPSAPPLPEFAHSFSVEEASLSQFDENREGAREEKLVDENPISESFGSLIIQEMPVALTNAGRQLDASNQVPKRSKLKSVKSLRVDTGRSRDRSSAMSYSFQNGDQSETLVCSQNCGTECAACIALFGISEFERIEDKEEMIAEDKGYMNPPAWITMEENKEEPNPENYAPQPQDLVDIRLQKRLCLLDSTSPLHFKDDSFAKKETPQCTAAADNTELSESVIIPEPQHDSLTPLELESSLSNNENIATNKIAEAPEDCQLEGPIHLGTERIEENEDISPLDKENMTPDVSGNIIMETSHRGLKPTISQELMDSISPLNLEHDNLSENEYSMMNIGNQMESNEPASENLSPLIPADIKFQKSQTNSMPISHLEFKDDDILLDRENSVLASEKYDTISPMRQEDLFSDKENMTPASRDRKPIARRVLGLMMDNSASAENMSNKTIHKRDSAKSKDFHMVDDDVFYSDKENLTPISSGGMKARNCFPKSLTVDSDQDQEAFFSDKENLTPVSSVARKTRDMSELRARIESAITKKRVVDRLPFQTLLSNSPLRPPSSSDCNCAVARPADIAACDLEIKLEDKLNNIPCNKQESGVAGQGMKAWTMVANIDSLLDDESRKCIMLLKGIKGTHLFIPRIVIRELDSMKQREGLFRRSTKATSILRWIEECMETESWWIHVQSSSDMFPVAPTPPATPSAQRIDEEIAIGSGGSFNPMAALFSPRSFTLADIVSPKPEDRVLDSALQLNKLRSNHNVVVLANSVALKIKAMAEGLLCEGAKEFRESLMNPCSGRFMWSASAPRGSAWSCLDEAALAENYYNSHHRSHARKRIPRPAAKGLKLILRHNSLYAQATTNSVARMPPLASMASV